MQVLINIDDDLYTRLFDNGEDDITDMSRACTAIRKGITLPKGHGDLVDIDEIWHLYDYSDIDYTMIDAVENAPTIVEADTESEVKDEKHEIKVEVVTRGNCMMCGKELTEGEGIFFCKECDDKILSIEEVCRK